MNKTNRDRIVIKGEDISLNRHLDNRDRISELCEVCKEKEVEYSMDDVLMCNQCCIDHIENKQIKILDQWEEKG